MYNTQVIFSVGYINCDIWFFLKRLNASIANSSGKQNALQQTVLPGQ